MPAIEPDGFHVAWSDGFRGGGAGELRLGAGAGARRQRPVIRDPEPTRHSIVINGRDASYAVVEGDWGLSRPGACRSR